MIVSLGPRFLLSDRSPTGEPGRAWGQSGWGIPRWGAQSASWRTTGTRKPLPIGARYFCGDCDSAKENKPVAQGHKFGATKAAYQEAVTAHYADEHKDLHYPIDQDGLDAMHKAKMKAESILRMNADLKDLKKWNGGVGGGSLDLSSEYLEVKRPRELPDLTEFDFPDANVADAGSEEIELDQLISIQARQGRRFLGVELQNFRGEWESEFLTVPDNADLSVTAALQLNTRSGAHQLDDPENLWRWSFSSVAASVEAAAGAGTAITDSMKEDNRPTVGGQVYVAPRLFFRFTNDMDRQVDAGDLFTRIASVDQRLSTFLLFELLEQYSGLFGLT